MSGEPTPHPERQEQYCPSCDRSFGEGTLFCPEDGTRLIRLTETDAMIGRQIDGRFTIRERLGQGGMGVVYRAWQASVGREVAIKMIRPRPGHDASTAKRFLREAKLASQLSQPSTVGVIDFGQAEDGSLYLVMELLRGRTLADVLRDQGRMSPERVVRIGMQICDALEAAHRLGIVHRDVKPANVMILDDPPGRDLIKVLDFGLAKVIDSDESTVTQSGRMVGTPSHLPPEVALGAPATHKSDLYALGVMLFEMLDGRPPFTADSVNMMVALHAYQPAPELGPHVSRPLAQVVASTLSKRPEARPETAAQLRTLLEAALRGEQPAPLAVEVTADSDEQRRSSSRSGIHSPEALAETFRKPKTRPPVVPEVKAMSAGAADFGPAEAAAPPPMSTDEAAAPFRRRRWPWLVGISAVLGGAIALAMSLGGGSEKADPPSPSGAGIADPADAAAAVAMPPPDAAVPDAALVDAAPVDAVPVDARPRRTDAGPRPPKPVDAACHPFDDDC